jgi:hypothetical protein
LICNAEGNLLAAAVGATETLLPLLAAGDRTDDCVCNLSELLGQDSELTQWLAEQFSEAAKADSHIAESLVVWRQRRVQVKFDCLLYAGHVFGYAIQISDSNHSNLAGLFKPAPSDGDTVVTRQQWHEIKNHLGGLKLYATFLRRKIAGDENQVVVEKLLKGINGFIDHLARIRKGDSK